MNLEVQTNVVSSYMDEMDQKTCLSKGEKEMRNKIFALISMMILLISASALTVLAGMQASSTYNTTGRQYIGSATNGPYSTETASGKLTPTVGVAQLQICNAAGTTIHAYGNYPVYPLNTSYVTYQVPGGVTVSFYVKPVNKGDYVYGSIVYGIEPY